MDVCHGLEPFVGVQGAEDEHHDHDVGALGVDAVGEGVGCEVPYRRLDGADWGRCVQRVFLWILNSCPRKRDAPHLDKLDCVLGVVVRTERELWVAVCR